MSVFVVDSSVAAKWFLREEHSQVARQILDPVNQLHAPHLYLLEMHNILCKWLRRGHMSQDEADRIRNSLPRYRVRIHDSDPLLGRSYAIANRTGRSLYDCLYLALAERLACRMVTADRRLYDGLADGPFGTHVLWVEDV